MLREMSVTPIYVLLVALPAFDEADYIARPAGGCGTGVVVDLLLLICFRLHMGADEAAFVAAGAASTSWLIDWWFEIGTHKYNYPLVSSRQ